MPESSRKTALVTGSTDGVGRMVAMRLAADGFRVLVHGRDAARGAEVVAEITGAGGTAEFLQADLGSLAEVRRLAAAVRNGDGPARPSGQQCRHRAGHGCRHAGGQRGRV